MFVDTYRNGKSTEIEVDISVPSEPDCYKTYGNKRLLFGIDWSYATHDKAGAKFEKLGMQLADIRSKK